MRKNHFQIQPEKTIKSRKEKSQSVHSNELEKVILQVTSTKTFLKRQEPKDTFKTTPAKMNSSDNIKKCLWQKMPIIMNLQNEIARHVSPPPLKEGGSHLS